MEPDSQDLTRQDENLSARDYRQDEERDHHDFGNWPEVAGLVFTLIVVWLSFAFTG